MRHVNLLIITIGIFYCGLSGADELVADEMSTSGMVTVEPDNIIQTGTEQGSYQVLPYRERRPNWGKVIAVSYSTFEPTNYEPNFLQVEFDDIYKQPEMPMIEAQFAFKRNASFGSYGLELSAGIYKNDSDRKALIRSSLQLIPVRFGAVYFMDVIRSQPNIVPYGGGGAYVILYKENTNDSKFSGNTQPAPYFHAGLAFSLDWIDRQAARISYEDSGIEATFAFVEARTQFEAQADQDPDFSSQINAAAGLRVEF